MYDLANGPGLHGWLLISHWLNSRMVRTSQLQVAEVERRNAKHKCKI